MENENRVIRDRELNNLNEFERTILKDFYLSFRLSEGKPLLQSYVMVYAAQHYTKDGKLDLDLLNSRMLPHIKKLKPPAMHTQTINIGRESRKHYVPLTFELAQNTEAGFTKQWAYNLKVLERVFFDTPKPPLPGAPIVDANAVIYFQNGLTKNMLLAEIIDITAMRDTNFQNKGRENRIGDADPHESFLRTYVFENKKTGSESFDLMFEEVRKIISELGLNGKRILVKNYLQKANSIGIEESKAREIKTSIEGLVKDWKIKHPKKKFF